MTDDRDMNMEVEPLLVEGIDTVEVSAEDDGFKLYVERHDGAGVAIGITPDEREGLAKTFMLTDAERGDA